VPVWTRRNQHGIDVGAGQQFAQVAVHRAIGISIMFVGLFLNGLAAGRFDVADRDKLNVRLAHEAAQVVSASIAETDATQHDSLARRDAAVHAKDTAGKNLRREQQTSRFKGGF